jgi:hypothetical protein
MGLHERKSTDFFMILVPYRALPLRRIFGRFYEEKVRISFYS